MITKKRALEILKILESDIDDNGIIYTNEELDFIDYCSKNFKNVSLELEWSNFRTPQLEEVYEVMATRYNDIRRDSILKSLLKK